MSVPQEIAVRPSAMSDVLDAMAQNLAELERRGDNRAVFQRVYLIMTRRMQERLAGTFFDDPSYVERVLVGFAGYYFRAFHGFEQGGHCAPAWEHTFRVAAERRAFVLQDALLGINAHINNDLPQVLADIVHEDGDWPDARRLLRRRADHERVNDVLGELVDHVQDELAARYARLIRVVDRAMGRRDEALASFIMSHFRATVWHKMEHLLNAHDAGELDGVRRDKVEKDAMDLAMTITDRHSQWLMRRVAPVTRRLRLF